MDTRPTVAPKQTSLVSAIETTLNIGSGFILALIVWQILARILDIPMPLSRNLLITTIFTVVSWTRSYFWRRFFSKGLHRRLVKRIGKWL